MKVNDIIADDCKLDNGKLVIHFPSASATMEAIAAMDTSIITVKTDAGDIAEIFAGYSLATVMYDRVGEKFIATLDREITDTMAAAVDGLTSQLIEQSNINADIMAALIELGGLVAQEAPAEIPKEVK